MNKATILDALHHHPNRPKQLHLTDGTRLEVPHPDQLVFPGEPAVCVLFRRDGGFRVIELAHIVSVDVPAVPANP
jgi:hypothetical protein